MEMGFPAGDTVTETIVATSIQVEQRQTRCLEPVTQPAIQTPLSSFESCSLIKRRQIHVVADISQC